MRLPCGVQIDSAEELFEAQRDLLRYLMRLGRELENRLFEQLGDGYEGAVVHKGEATYKFVAHRPNTIHGLFGEIRYRRAYYARVDGGTGSWIPLDRRLGIEKRHTPGLNYFLSSFTGREAYQESLNRFHEIFRPDGVQLISMRKALDLDYEVGTRIEENRQQEIRQVFNKQASIQRQRPIEERIAVSIDATKLRQKQGEYIDDDGARRYEIGFRDAKIAVISEVRWDGLREEASCSDSSYVAGIEHADEFFRRIWVELNRRTGELPKKRMVFLGDGAKWIWDRVSELANEHSVFILDFYHAAEHLSTICKELYGEQSQEYWRHFNRWRTALHNGKVTNLIAQLRRLRDRHRGAKRQMLQGEINYFQENKERMRYDRYRRMQLPIGSGTVESACKNVIGGRMKQGGMTWSETGALGMLQIRASLASDRFLRDFRQTLRFAA